MRIAFATTFDSENVHKWSGTPYHMANALKTSGHQIEHVGKLSKKLSLNFKLRRTWKWIACRQRESSRFNTQTAMRYSLQLAEKLKLIKKPDVIIAPQINPIAYLDCQQPIILWTDSLYASLLGFYPGFSQHSASSIAEGNAITAACLNRCRYAVFSSDWAARSAIEIYGMDPDKVKVIPFGANLNHKPAREHIISAIKNRSKDCVKLLFLGKQWDRKGGDIVFNITKSLHQAGVKVELNFVGCYPPNKKEVPDYIKLHGFISKHHPEGRARLNELLSSSHFLFVPSRAEAYGIVFCEANAYGLPCITTSVGGISTIVKNNVNGKMFGLNADPKVYCHYIKNLMNDYSQYEALAISSYNEFEKRLNWESAVESMNQLLTSL